MWWEVPGHLEVKGNRLTIGGLYANDLAEKFGTPSYVYNTDRVRENYRRFIGTMNKHSDRHVEIRYAMKANNTPEIISALLEEGSGIDAVSPEEAACAVLSGFPQEKIILTGTSMGKTDFRRIVDYHDIVINTDSESGLANLYATLIQDDRLPKNISFRFNPGRGGGGGSWKTITAGAESHGVPVKFGTERKKLFDLCMFAKTYRFNLVGIHMHVGSQWLSKNEVNEYLSAVDRLLEAADYVSKQTEIPELGFIDFGGGPGIRYKPKDEIFPLEYYAEQTLEKVKKSRIKAKKLLFEPGRYIVGDAGLLLTRVTTRDIKNGNLIVGVDTGFNHLIRPAMYGAYHEIINCTRADSDRKEKVTVAGNLCETGDVLAANRLMPHIDIDDVLAIHNAGAYGYVMHSEYNMRPPPKEVLISKGNAKLSIRS